MATAFCGFCSGCAAEARSTDDLGHAPQSVTRAADSDYKVILNPGWYYSGNTKTENTITDTGVTKMTQAEAEAATGGYFVENAYFATVAAGENLPAAETTRTGMTFGGWWYVKDGETVKVETMPAAADLDGHLYLYAQWSVGTGGGGGGGGGDVTTGAKVNGEAMSVNDQNDDQEVETEYMLKGVQLSSGATLAFTVGGSPVTLTEVEASSSGITKTPGSVQTTQTGLFDIYLKKLKAGGWRLYVACQTETSAEDCVAGSVYLVGNVASASLSWAHFNEIDTFKGIKASGSGTSYSLTVDLTAGDNCKIVMFDNVKNNRKWQGNLTGGGSNISAPGATTNMTVSTTGNYTFTITVSGNSLNVSVVKN